MFSPKTVCIRALIVMFCIIVVNGSNNMSLQSCQKMDSCSCVLNDGNVIDLHFAAHSDSGIPVFHYQSSQSPAYYKYSPCSGLPCGGATKNASLCLESSFLRPSADLGTVSSVEFHVTGKNITLVYHATNGKTTKSSLSRDTGTFPTAGVIWSFCRLKCCFTSTETVGLLGTGAQDVHLDFHRALKLLYLLSLFKSTPTPLAGID